MTMKDFITYCREVAEINRAFGSYLNELAGTLEGGSLPAGPLTLDELREMDGEPVYLDFTDGGEWALVRVQKGKVFITHKNTICAPVNILIACGGKAYRRRPVGKEMES